MNKNNIFVKSIFDISEYYKIIFYKSKIDYTASYIPNINIVKLHGSINWKIEKDNIIYNNLQNEINDYNNIGIVLPTDEKFKSTVINRIYYSSLRYFSAELERENTFTFSKSFGFGILFPKAEVMSDINAKIGASLFFIISIACFSKLFRFYKL